MTTSFLLGLIDINIDEKVSAFPIEGDSKDLFYIFEYQ